MDERPHDDTQPQQWPTEAPSEPEPAPTAAPLATAPWWRQPGPVILAAAVIIAAGIGTGIAVAGSGGSAAQAAASPSPSPSMLDVAGSITIPFGTTLDQTARDTSPNPRTAPVLHDPCVAEGGYTDISEGTAVTVGGSTGQTLGIGSLGPGLVFANSAGNAECQFGFSVSVPAGQSIYTVTISHRGTQTFTPDQVAAGIQLTLG